MIVIPLLAGINLSVNKFFPYYSNEVQLNKSSRKPAIYWRHETFGNLSQKNNVLRAGHLYQKFDPNIRRP